MLTFFLILHLLIAAALVGVILLQRSEGGGLGIGGGGMDGVMSSRETANFLTRLTAILAVAFMASSLLLATLVEDRRDARSIIDTPIAGDNEDAIVDENPVDIKVLPPTDGIGPKNDDRSGASLPEVPIDDPSS